MFNRRKTLALFITALAFLCLVAVVTFKVAERQFLTRLANQNDATLRLVAGGLRDALMRFEPLPGLLASKTDMKWLLINPGNQTQIDHLNRELKKIAEDFGASDIYVMDDSGLTIAASNFDDVSFIGKSFSYRPYFTGAAQGDFTRYFALGTTSLVRGYYFATPIHVGSQIKGVIAVKIEIDSIEENWRGSDHEIMVTDGNGVIFMAGRKDWHFKTLEPLDEAKRAEIAASKQYTPDQLTPLDITTTPSELEHYQIVTISDDEPARSFLARREFMEDANWTLHVLTPRTSAINQAYTVTSVTVLALLLLGLVVTSIILRRARLIRNIELQKQTQEQLERRVEERTRELNETNRQLTQEVEERTQAEKRLRSTQNELIQAGKLAALGQMSASLSHELNQPLSAVKSYADNARAYLKRHKTEEADANIGRISEMADRMAELGQHLRNFARKPQQKIDAVNLQTMIESVVQLMSGRLKQTNAVLNIEPFDDTIMVQGGQVRLQQVMVNLINNALDAMNGSAQPAIEVSVSENPDAVTLAVRDHGNGLDEGTIEKIFDPFFTTKGVNEGLGLGLSISYNIIRDFGGNITARNHQNGGAIFQVTLLRSDIVQSAAE